MTKKRLELKTILVIGTLILILLPMSAGIKVEYRSRALSGFTESSTGLPDTGVYVTVGLGLFNNDNQPDIASGLFPRDGLAGAGMGAWLNVNGAGSWTNSSVGLPDEGAFGQIAIGDIDGNGADDIVGPYETRYSVESTTGIGIWLSSGGPTVTWTSGNSPTSTGSYLAVDMGFVDSDSDIDIAAAGEGSGIEVWLGNGGGSWTPASTGLPSNGEHYGICLGDLNRDGNTDLVAGSDSGVKAYLGNGGTGWNSASSGLPGSGTYHSINITDVNNDGNHDIVSSGQNGIYIFTGNGGAGGTMKWESNSSGLPNFATHGQIATGDVDNDGNIDLLTGQMDGNGVKLYLGDGGAGGACDWTRYTQGLPTAGAYSGSFMTDVDNDGDLDIIVSDSSLSSSSSIGVEVYLNDMTSFNRPPVPDAGNDLTVTVGETVYLNASGSSDPDGTIVDYSWAFVSKPPGSVAELSDDTSVNPSILTDVVGQYVIELGVRDNSSKWSLWKDVVNITANPPANLRPIANAGLDYSCNSNTSVTLNGSSSWDGDGIIITWDWNFTSHPTLPIINENSSSPTFTPTMPGIYALTLVVRDDQGAWSEESQVNITVIEVNRPPIANAGGDVTAYTMERVDLDGSRSWDTEGKILAWDWNCTSHAVVLNDSNSSTPYFVPRMSGVYVFTLRVMDEMEFWSYNSDVVNVTVLEKPIYVNERPVANAGEDRMIRVNETVVLDGTNSFDEDGNITTWDWNCTSHPSLLFENENSSTPSFRPLKAGTYVITLVVADEVGARSSEDTVVMIAIPENVSEPDLPKINTPPTITIKAISSNEAIPQIYKIEWTAHDADGDSMLISLELLDGEMNVIKTLASDLNWEAGSWEWSMEGEREGRYKVRITVSDGTDEAHVLSPIITLVGKSVEEPDSNANEQGSSVLGLGLLIVGLVVVLLALLVIFLVLRGKMKKRFSSLPEEMVDEWRKPRKASRRSSSYDYNAADDPRYDEGSLESDYGFDDDDDRWNDGVEWG